MLCRSCNLITNCLHFQNCYHKGSQTLRQELCIQEFFCSLTDFEKVARAVCTQSEDLIGSVLR